VRGTQHDMAGHPQQLANLRRGQARADVERGEVTDPYREAVLPVVPAPCAHAHSAGA
jgi:hypothetical protein